MIKKTFLLFVIVLLGLSCSSDFDKIEIEISLEKLLDAKDFDFMKGKSEKTGYYLVKVEIQNNTDTTFSYVSMNCTWQENWISNKNNFFLLPETNCIHNSADLYSIKAKKIKTLYSVLIVNGSLENFNNQNSKLGFVHIQLNEVPADIKFKDVLRFKLENRKNIVWSNPIFLKE